MTPKQKGELSEQHVIVRCMELGYTVSKPVGDSARYDLIVDDGSSLKRMQVKTGKLTGSKMVFYARSNNWNNGTRKGYHGEVEGFLVYCPQNDKVYKLDIKECGASSVTLRTGKVLRRGKETNVIYKEASKYEV